MEVPVTFENLKLEIKFLERFFLETKVKEVGFPLLRLIFHSK